MISSGLTVFLNHQSPPTKLSGLSESRFSSKVSALFFAASIKVIQIWTKVLPSWWQIESNKLNQYQFRSFDCLNVFLHLFITLKPFTLTHLALQVLGLTWAGSLLLDKMTAGLFSEGLYLLLLQRKFFRASQLKPPTKSLRHKVEER